ncbi:hypothetical protein B0A50_03713 [Salinomyces thailandicus]|uniref:Glutamyl/glutaminyl-tRNA synthetase class Ib catalytic domain-containing protein n=1 Tax=Salinomyces thailandicus TaxID=706561 RepID=A0A4U0U2J3_9PEZI|nr:hypothetical protein B0A50_03713 [Salinomyces thailandica]
MVQGALKRLVPGAEDRLISDLQWAGIQWDEGPLVGGPYGPYRQSERNEIYQRHARELLDSGNAYRCFCTTQTAGQGTKAYVTSGCYQNCASLPDAQAQEKAESEKQPFTIRLKLPSPQEAKQRTYSDLIYGKIKPLKRSPTALASAATSAEGSDNGGIDAADTILVKSDGTPTYHFANVIDDHLMKITHVIRGTEWLASTPLHYDLYHAFNWPTPTFAHVGLLVDENKAKLSKRNTDLALDVASMRDAHGVVPETLTNFLALLGWSNPTRDDVKDLNELIADFDLKLTKGNTMVRMEKLWYLQKQHVARSCAQASTTNNEDEKSSTRVRDLAVIIANEALKQYPELLTSKGWDNHKLQIYCSDILLADSKTYISAPQYVHRNRYFFLSPAAFALANKEEQEPQAASSSSSSSTFTASSNNDISSSSSSPSSSSSSSSSEEDLKTLAQTALESYMTQTSSLSLSPSPSPTPSSSNLENDNNNENPSTRTSHLERESAAMHDQLEASLKHSPPERRKALMKYLREKLSYGLPGPSMATVMVILGLREVCKRLGIEIKGTSASGA